MQLALYTKATHTSCDLAPITQRANFCTLFNTAKKAGGARKAKVGQTLPTYYGEDSFREIDRGHDGETVVCASVAWFSSVLLDPVAPPPSLGGADAHAAALSGPQNLHLTHGGRSAADNHPPAAAFDTHKLQKRRTEREARKIQGQEHGQGQVLPLRNCGRGHSGSVAGEDPKIPAIYFLVGLDGRGPASRAPGALHLGDLALGPPHCFVCSNMRRARIDVIFDTVFMCTRYEEYA